MASARAKDVWSCGARPSMISWGGAAGASVVAAAADDDTANTSPNLPNNKTILFHFTTRKVEHKKHSTPNGQSTPTPRVAELTDTFLKPTNGGYKLICPPKVRRAGRGVTPKRVQKFSIIVFGYICFFSPFFSVPEVCRMTVCIRMTVCMCGAVCGYCCAMAVGRLWRAHDVDRV